MAATMLVPAAAHADEPAGREASGVVLAKGTFNNLAQLESVLGAAERRQAERDAMGAIGV